MNELLSAPFIASFDTAVQLMPLYCHDGGHSWITGAEGAVLEACTLQMPCVSQGDLMCHSTKLPMHIFFSVCQEKWFLSFKTDLVITAEKHPVGLPPQGLAARICTFGR